MEGNFRVAIVGAGQLGRAVAKLLGGKHVDLAMWDANPAALPAPCSLEDAVRGARFVLFCVPSGAMRTAVTGALPHMEAGAAVVSFAKGMERDTRETMAEMLPPLITPGHPLVVVGGPMLADDILAGRNAAGVFASTDPSVRGALAQLFTGPAFAAEESADPASVALAGVLKNIYAVSLGIADGLGVSESEKGWLTDRAAAEMEGIAARLGTDPAVMRGTAGLGDLLATGYSASSRNRGVGEKIAKAEPLDLRGEGLTALPSVIGRLGEEQAASFPLLVLIDAVADGAPAGPAFSAFFSARR